MEDKKSSELQPLKKKPDLSILNDIGRKGAHLYDSVTSVPATVLILLLGFYLLLGYLTQLVEDDLVRVVSDAEVAPDSWSTFSEESSWRYLRQIAGDGPRVCGTPQHLNKTRHLRGLALDIAAAAWTPVRVDWQLHTDNFMLNQISPHVSYYHNASNVIALLEGQAGTDGTTTLVNCHYDSVPFAQGASDDAVFCAVMMETLRRLSQRRSRLKHNVVFLFNGAEENGLQGSHAFLSHPWFRNVTSVVNLDSAGINGKATLFQVTDPRVLAVYSRTTHKPNAQSFGEFLFSSGIIPSDTDFRVWRDYGNIHGVDLAFTKGGHVYHTRYDHVDLVKPGVMQYAGNMLLGLVTALADSDDFDHPIEPSAAVYYDYLNTFMAAYSYRTALAVDLAVAVLAAASVLHYVWLVGLRWSTVQELLFSILGRLLAMAGGMAVVVILTPIMVAATGQLRYLSQPWLVVALYWVPWLTAAVAVAHAYDSWRTKKSGMNRSIRAAQAQAATRALTCVSLLLLVSGGAPATGRYLLTVPLFILSVVSAVSITVLRTVKLQGWQHLSLEVVLSLPALLFPLSIALRVSALLLPVQARSSLAAADAFVALVSVALAVYCASAISGIELLFSRKRLWMVLSGTMAVCVVIMFIPMNPYQDEGPSTQRHYWFHTQIVTYNYNGQQTESTHGLYVSRQDANTVSSMQTMVRQRFNSISTRSDFTADCETKVYCNLPLMRPRFADDLKNGLFLYTGPPAPYQPPPSVTAHRTCLGETCLLQFTVYGPGHNLLTFWPVSQTNITGWSFKDPPSPTLYQLQRPVYVAIHSTATYQEQPATLAFNITMTVPLSLQSGPVLLTSHHAHKIQHPEDFTAEYQSLLDGAPKYFNIATFLTHRTNYEF